MGNEIRLLVTAALPLSFALADERTVESTTLRNGFHVSADPRGYRFENSAQRFTVLLDTCGVEICEASPGTDYLMLETIGIGRSETAPVSAVRSVVLDDSSIAFERDGLAEWFVNDARGLELGYTLYSPIAPVPNPSHPIVIELRIAGSMTAEERSNELSFASNSREFVLGFGPLRVFDATNRELPATMRLASDRVRISVDDRDARYPIVVDPLAYNANWSATVSNVNSGFGASSAGAGDVNGDGFRDAIIGAPTYTMTQSWQGRAYQYSGSPGGFSTVPSWLFQGSSSLGLTGADVAGLGDFDGDGFDDVAVGSPGEGRVYVFRGSASGLGSLPAMVIQSFGWSIGETCAGGGDFDADGFPDLLVGAPNLGPSGTAFSYRGATNPTPTSVWSFDAAPYSVIGSSLSAAGDVDNDGFDDVIVGAIGTSHSQLQEGAALFFRGSAAGLGATPHWAIEGNFVSAHLGRDVAGAGDINGDGFDDLAISASNFAGSELDEGIVYLYLGSPTGPAASPANSLRSGQGGSRFGHAVDSARDVDGDGFDDLLIGAPDYHDAPTSFQRGRLFVYLGSPAGLETTPAWYSPKPASEFLGTSVAGPGDVNGDGYADVIGGGANQSLGIRFAECYHGGPFASLAPYGRGKSISEYPPRLLSLSAPLIGSTATLQFQGGTSAASGVLLFAGLQPLEAPFDAGTVFVAPLWVIGLPNLTPAGNFLLPIAIPPSSALSGVDVYFQAAFPNSGAAGPYQLVMSNGLRWILGA